MSKIEIPFLIIKFFNISNFRIILSFNYSLMIIFLKFVFCIVKRVKCAIEYNRS